MQGLLHRLAARAGGTALVVRPDVRLPFASAGPSLGETLPDGIDQVAFAPPMADVRIDVDADGHAAAQAGTRAAQARPGASAAATGPALDDDPRVRAGPSAMRLTAQRTAQLPELWKARGRDITR